MLNGLCSHTVLYVKTEANILPLSLIKLTRLKPQALRLWNGFEWVSIQSLKSTKNINEKTRLEVSLRNGQRISCTEAMTFMTHRGAVRASQLRYGDRIEIVPLDATGIVKDTAVNEDIAWLIGFYLASGYKKQHGIEWLLPQKQFQLINFLIDKDNILDGQFVIEKHNHLYQVYLQGHDIYQLLNSYVYGSNHIQRHFKDNIWHLPDTLLRTVMHGFLDGLAEQKDNTYYFKVYFNASLETQLRVLASRLGASLVLELSDNHHYARMLSGEWQWDYNDLNPSLGMVLAVIQAERKIFWDITVADEPYTFALASGILLRNAIGG